MEELKVPEELECDHPDFDPDAETWMCRSCRHTFSLSWSDDEFRFRPVRPVGVVDLDHACADCRRRINGFIERYGRPGVRRRVRGGVAGGGLQPGVNFDSGQRPPAAVPAGAGERGSDP